MSLMNCKYRLQQIRLTSHICRIELYFQRIQVFLPLFHRPQFEQSYINKRDHTRYTNLTMDRAYMFYGMLALSARFSSSSYFGDTPPKERGRHFARRAREICHRLLGDTTPTLVWLQGHSKHLLCSHCCNPRKSPANFPSPPHLLQSILQVNKGVWFDGNDVRQSRIWSRTS